MSNNNLHTVLDVMAALTLGLREEGSRPVANLPIHPNMVDELMSNILEDCVDAYRASWVLYDNQLED